MAPIQYNEEIAKNLRGTDPIDWAAAKNAFSIAGFKPEKLKIVQRLPELQALCTVAEGEHTAIEKLAANSDVLMHGTAAQKKLRLIARQYVALQNKKARLPKFSKWVASLFKDDQELGVEVAKLGQQVVAPDAPFVISCHPVDIMRCADTKHYWSCLNDTGMYNEVVPGVLQECPGIAVAYVNGDDGKMKGRVWVHRGEVKGKSCVILASHIYGNGFTLRQLADFIANKSGENVYVHSGYWDEPPPGPEEYANYIGCFTHNIHWDTPTWIKRAPVKLLSQGK